VLAPLYGCSNRVATQSGFYSAQRPDARRAKRTQVHLSRPNTNLVVGVAAHFSDSSHPIFRLG